MTVSDEQLMLDIMQGSTPAFELFVRRWNSRMLCFFQRCVGNAAEAEDLRQDLFLRVYQKRSSYRQQGRFEAWLYRIAANLVIDKHARKKKGNLQPLDTMDESVEAAHDSSAQHSRCCAAMNEYEERIFQSLQLIPEGERIVLVLRHFENLNFREIADLIDTPESTVKSRVYRGLQSMRQQLKQAGIMENEILRSV